MVFALTACALSAGTTASIAALTDGPCSAPAGGRCAGPEPVAELVVSADGRTLGETVNCGGRLSARERADHVTVTFTVTSAGAGTMSCPRGALTVTLHAPLNGRTVIDATTGEVIAVSSGDPYQTS